MFLKLTIYVNSCKQLNKFILIKNRQMTIKVYRQADFYSCQKDYHYTLWGGSNNVKTPAKFYVKYTKKTKD